MSKIAKPTDYLKSVGIDIFLQGHNSYKLASTGYMDLTVETWQEGKNTMVSMCHYGEQNGDLMADPDVLFKLEQEIITYREIQMDYTRYYSEDHAEIKDFMENTWVSNLIMQGHKVIKKEVNDIEYQLDDQGEMVEVTAQ
tara:strand:- start:193 stop:612 length:420 start_codon:yes stop_codon:yes gene_type:complete